MNKKSAMAIAAGLVAAMLSGVAALSIGLGAGSAAVAQSQSPKPIVRTVKHTVTVHKKAKAQGGGVVTIVRTPSSPAPTVSSDSYGDDQYEGEYDDQYESHESDGGGDDGSSHDSYEDD
ncbi:MAG TPA: hypothetical protein VF984_03110 [Actinomycetota bacterium]